MSIFPSMPSARMRIWLACLLLACILTPQLQASTTSKYQYPDTYVLQTSPINRQATSSLLLDLIRVGSRLLALGQGGHILYSDDQGQSWQQAQVPTTSLLTSITFSDARTGWAVGHQGLILTTQDAGASWQIAYRHAEYLAQAAQIHLPALRTQVDQLSQAVQNAPAHQRADMEAELEQARWDLEDARFLYQPEALPPLLDIHFSSAQEGWAVGAYNTLIHTQDGGQTWQPISQRIPNPDGMHLYAVTHLKDALFIAGEGGFLAYSTDQGQHWSTLDSPYQGSWFHIQADPQQGHLYLLGLRGHAFVSQDQGHSWQSLFTSDTQTTPKVSFNALRILADGALVLWGQAGEYWYQPHNQAPWQAYQAPQGTSLMTGLALNHNTLLAVGQGGLHKIKHPQVVTPSTPSPSTQEP
ncbi:Uncharacterized protein SAMN05421831_10518 [Allopseudospirillum japonicum]|uniref:Photosynthesis system II assembly factor Ycf48/Hcf136-like domain-containing protein n=1 Tax=Allopseudospirillum japonicum TaxID=64971 RepID=A0A1H6RYD8_9GAMM|nr:YCF48-related protein [Allopseudospirillum japonicum]SEI59436.1 Uncharacterized protein SAMN05421831_10518 [Allopseudospirillum japonicum]